jgi:hypothetical protein
VDNVLYAASRYDAEIYRAVNRWEGQLDPADAIEANPALAERARLVNHTPNEDDPFPTREQLLSAVGSAI